MITRYTMITATRDWLFLGILIMVMIAAGLSVFFGSNALAEQSHMIASYLSASTRGIIITGLVLFVCFNIRRSFENKEIELMLSKPISRTSFVFSYFIGFSALSFVIICPLVMLIILLEQVELLQADLVGVLVWGVSLYLESLIMMAFAFFAALFFKSAISSVFLCIGFYLLSRMFGFFLISVHNPMSLMRSGDIGYYGERILYYISIFLPRLDMFAKSEWVVYGIGHAEQISVFMVSAVIYIPLILYMACFDLLRKQF